MKGLFESRNDIRGKATLWISFEQTMDSVNGRLSWALLCVSEFSIFPLCLISLL
jgi:hypothetical protein